MNILNNNGVLGQNILPYEDRNSFANQTVLKDTQKVTMPWEEVYNVTHSLVVDSRQRNCAAYRTPSYYTIDLGDVFKNITSIELKGATIPKSSYNIHSSNNKIDFAIGDQITGFQILSGGSGYTFAPTIVIDPPPGPGVQALAHSVINAQGIITNIVIDVAGSGYIPGKPPLLIISPPQNTKQAKYPKIYSIVGTHYTAVLRVGEYEIGGNPVPPSLNPTSLLNEIQNAMNYVVNGGAYDTASISPFSVRLVSQYPELNAAPGTPEAANTNACLFNRIQVVNVNGAVWEFLWCSGPNHAESAASVFGFNTVDSGTGTMIAPVFSGLDLLIPGGTAIRGPFDYNLKDIPEFVVMTIFLSGKRMDRLKSLDDGLENRFAVLLFDNNNPETLHDLSGSTVNIGGITYLQGPTGKGPFWRDSGYCKPIKGYDFDSKRLIFKPPAPKIGSITVMFTKYGYTPGGAPQFYNMEGREHTLMFELQATDNRSLMKN